MVNTKQLEKHLAMAKRITKEEYFERRDKSCV